MAVQKKHSVVAVVCLFLFSSLAGCLDNPEIDDEPAGEVDLGDLDMYSADRFGEKVWNVEMVITGQDLDDIDEVHWEEMGILVYSRNGQTDLIDITPLQGSVPLALGAKYVPIDPSSGTVAIGDRIIFHGIGEEYEGGTVELVWDETVVSSMLLPILFVPDIDVTLDDPVMGSIIFPASTSYTYEAEVTSIDPANATLNWWTLQLRLESPTDEFSDLFGPLMEDPGVEGYDDGGGTQPVEFWYIDDPLNGTNGPGTPDAMDEGDSVKITGLSEKYEGAIVTLLKGEDPVWNGTIPDMPEPDMTLELGSPNIHSVNKNETAFWNVSIPIEEIDPDDLVLWSSVWIKVLDLEDNVRHIGELFQDQGDYRDTVLGYWSEDEPLDYLVSTGDNIVIKGLNLSFQGGGIEVYRGYTLFDSVTLPSQWPIPDLWISTKDPYFTNRTVDSVKYWDGSFNITHVNPENIVLSWEDIDVRIVDRGTEEVLIPLTGPELWEWEHRTEPTIFYHEGGSPDGIDYKDLIVLSGLDLSFEGSYIEFYLNGEMIGEERLEGPFDPAPTWMLLSSPEVARYDINGSYDFRIIININKITPKTVRIPWTGLQVKISNKTGYVLVPLSGVDPDTGNYDLNETDGFEIGLYYVETAGDSWLGAGDAFKFTGFTTAFEHATAEFYYQGVLIGSVILPTNFP